MNFMNDPEYRQGFVNTFLDSKLASQISALRQAKGLTQAQLAERLGTKQSQISRLESGVHASWSVRTLRKLASFFDVALNLEFAGFEAVIDRIQASKPEELAPPSGYDSLAHEVQSYSLNLLAGNLTRHLQCATPVWPATQHPMWADELLSKFTSDPTSGYFTLPRHRIFKEQPTKELVDERIAA